MILLDLLTMMLLRLEAIHSFASFEQLKNLTSLQTTIHSGGPWQRLSFSHIISIVPPRLDNTSTQCASDVITLYPHFMVLNIISIFENHLMHGIFTS